MAESFTVRTPVEGYSGVIAGVVFDAGRAVVDAGQTSALRYFRDAGYHVEANEAQAPTVVITTFPPTEEPAPPAIAKATAPPAKKAPAKKKAAARKAPARKRGQA